MESNPVSKHFTDFFAFYFVQQYGLMMASITQREKASRPCLLGNCVTFAR